MKPFRKNVAIAIDGGGIKGAICTRALSILENYLGKSCHEIFRLAVGTSTGSIISTGIAAGISAVEMDGIYDRLGQEAFPQTLRSKLWPILRYRYSQEPLRKELEKSFGKMVMGDIWKTNHPTDLVITTFDLQTNHTCFIKPWKSEYASWPVVLAIRASCTVPTYYPVVEGRYIDGGVGAYANPCFLAAYEAVNVLNWDPTETTLISLGTGRDPYHWDQAKARQFCSWQWLDPVLGAFLQSAEDQQLSLVESFFKTLDFRRFQVDTAEVIAMDDPTQLPQLVEYGEMMGKMILNDQVDQAMGVVPSRPKLKK